MPLVSMNLPDSGDENTIDGSEHEKILVNLVCDLLALGEMLPSQDKLEDLKRKLDANWQYHTRQVFEKANISEGVYTELKRYIQTQLYKSAMERFRTSLQYRFFNWLSASRLAKESWPFVLAVQKYLAGHLERWQAEIPAVSSAAAEDYFEQIMTIAETHFINSKQAYVRLIRRYLDDFVSSFVRVALNGLVIGHATEDLAAALDTEKAIELARKIYADLDIEVRERIKFAWMACRGRLLMSRRALNASLDSSIVKNLTERSIQKCGWDILRPLIHQTVLNLFMEQFRILAKDSLPEWIRFASTREVVRPLNRISKILPQALDKEIYSNKFMFGSTPLIQSLEKASMILLDQAYRSRDKVLVLISDGEFGESHSALISAELLKRRGVTIIACLIANRNVITRLVSQSESSWPKGAKLMLRMASTKAESSIYRGEDLKSPSDKLFYQINNAAVLDDVLGGIFDKPL